MNILVTGGTGYLGSRLVHRLVEENHQVLCVVLTDDSCAALDDIREKIKFCYTDSESTEHVICSFLPSVVIHMATVYERGTATMSSVFDANLNFPFRMLQLAIKAGAKTWINAGSVLSADLNAYSLSKAQLVQWGKLEAQRSRINFINLKLEHFYGKDAPATHFLSWVIQSLKKNEAIDLTGGTQRRDFVYVDDVVNSFVEMLHKNPGGYTEIQIGTGETPSIKEAVTYLKELCQSTSELRFGALPMRDGELESEFNPCAMQMYGLKCSYSWKDGFRKLI